MYRRPKFLEALLEIREAMAREADYDVELFAQRVRAGKAVKRKPRAKQAAADERPSVQKPRTRRLVTK